MIQAVFTRRRGVLTGFRVTGHAGLARAGRDILCAAVSSATLLAANTLTDAMGLPALVRVREGYLLVALPYGRVQTAQPLLAGLLTHLRALAGQYPRRLCVTLWEA